MKKDIFDLVPTRTIYTIAGIFFVAGIVMISWFGYRFYELQKLKKTISIVPSQIVTQVSAIKKCDFQRWFDGVCVTNEIDRFPALVAVMIENHTEARPLSGLAKASIVYEAPVEGMYTRFMAIFPLDEQVAKVGPVRSARPYYVDWTTEYGNIMYMHVGGSPEALNLIKKITMFDLNQFFHGNNFWRSTDRSAPHNVYTSNDLWKTAWAYSSGSGIPKDLKSWNFVDKEVCKENCINEINVSFLLPSYAVSWKYDSEKGKYIRHQAGALHKDQDGTQIEADTIIVQRISYEVLDNVGRLRLDTVGSGEALVFRDGYMTKGTWKKNSFGERTMWMGENGKFMELKTGKIWIEVVPEGRKVEYK